MLNKFRNMPHYEVLRSITKQYEVLRSTWKYRIAICMLRNITKCYEIHYEIYQCYEILRNTWKLNRCYETLRNPTEWYEMSRNGIGNITKCYETHGSTDLQFPWWETLRNVTKHVTNTYDVTKRYETHESKLNRCYETLRNTTVTEWYEMFRSITRYHGVHCMPLDYRN